MQPKGLGNRNMVTTGLPLTGNSPKFGVSLSLQYVPVRNNFRSEWGRQNTMSRWKRVPYCLNIMNHLGGVRRWLKICTYPKYTHFRMVPHLYPAWHTQGIICFKYVLVLNTHDIFATWQYFLNFVIAWGPSEVLQSKSSISPMTDHFILKPTLFYCFS